MQADRPFEQKERLKQLLARQTKIDSLLDLDKGDQQGAAPIPDKDEPDVGRTAPAASGGSAEVAKMAAAYMRESETAIRGMPITERTSPQMGQVTARAVAKGRQPQPRVDLL